MNQRYSARASSYRPAVASRHNSTVSAGKAFTVDTGGIGIDDWVYAMRDIRPADVVTLKTNGGQFNSSSSNGVAYEILNDMSLALLRAVALP